MKPSNYKSLHIIKQVSATNGATLTSDQVDTKDHNYCVIAVYATTSDAATNNPSTLKVQESDTTAATDFADITAFVGDGTGGFTVPSSPTATTTAPFAKFCLNLTKRKRYLRVLVTPLTTQTFSIVADLHQSDSVPVGTTDENVACVVRG